MEVLLKAGLATIALRKYDIFKAIDLAAEAGFAGVEIWGKPPHTPDQFDEDHTRKILDRLRENRLEVSMFGSYVNPCSPDYEQKKEDALKIARIIDARIIRVWAGNKEPHEAPDELWGHVASALHEYALRAGEYGIELAMEMHGGTLCFTPEGALRIIEEAGSPYLKLNYQVANPSVPEYERVIAMVGDHVINVHAQNYRPWAEDPSKMELCLVEEGQVNYAEVLRLLSKHGFDGFVEVEFLKGEFAESEEVMLDSLMRDAAYLSRLTASYSR